MKKNSGKIMISKKSDPADLSEEDLQGIFAGCPWPFLGSRSLRFVGLNRSPPGSTLKIDLLHETAARVNVWSEVEWAMIDLSQIVRYEAVLREGIESGLDELFWLIPDAKSIDVNLPATHVRVYRYNLSFMEDWARWRRECVRDLERIHSFLSQGFDYALGKSLEAGRKLNFANVVDALYYYGYVEIEDPEKGVRRRKVGFHLATIGWNLDLIRNLSAAANPFRDLYPDLLLKLILEVLEAPYRWEDPKRRRGHALTPHGFIAVVRNYRKTGSNWQKVVDICEQIHGIASTHRGKLLAHGEELRPALVDAGIAYWDLLEIQLGSILVTESERGVIDARVLLKEVINLFKLQQMPTSREFRLSSGELIAPSESADATGSASYAGYMALRLVELAVLKNILSPGLSMYPFYKVIAEAPSFSGEMRLQVIGVSALSHLTDTSLHRETLRIGGEVSP